MFNGDDENASIFEHCFVVLTQQVHMECCMREIEMAARSSFSRFFIYCQVFDCNPVDPFLQVHFPSPFLFQSFCFPFGVLWNPTNSWTQFINLFLVKRSSIACFIYQCFESCDMKTWLVINIVLIPQTCFAIENRPCSQFSHAQLFLQKKEKSDYALIEKKVWIEVCIRSVFLVYGKRSSVLGSSFPPGYF